MVLQSARAAFPVAKNKALNDGSTITSVNLGTCCGSKPAVGLQASSVHMITEAGRAAHLLAQVTGLEHARCPVALRTLERTPVDRARCCAPVPAGCRGIYLAVHTYAVRPGSKQEGSASTPASTTTTRPSSARSSPRPAPSGRTCPCGGRLGIGWGGAGQAGEGAGSWCTAGLRSPAPGYGVGSGATGRLYQPSQAVPNFPQPSQAVPNGLGESVRGPDTRRHRSHTCSF